MSLHQPSSLCVCIALRLITLPPLLLPSPHSPPINNTFSSQDTDVGFYDNVGSPCPANVDTECPPREWQRTLRIAAIATSFVLATLFVIRFLALALVARAHAATTPVLLSARKLLPTAIANLLKSNNCTAPLGRLLESAQLSAIGRPIFQAFVFYKSELITAAINLYSIVTLLAAQGQAKDSNDVVFVSAPPSRITAITVLSIMHKAHASGAGSTRYLSIVEVLKVPL